MASEPKDCDHHWHHVNTEHPDGPYGVKVRTDRCCQCGEKKVTRTDPTPAQNFTLDESDCGPFKPNIRVWW